MAPDSSSWLKLTALAQLSPFVAFYQELPPLDTLTYSADIPSLCRHSTSDTACLWTALTIDDEPVSCVASYVNGDSLRFPAVTPKGKSVDCARE